MNKSKRNVSHDRNETTNEKVKTIVSKMQMDPLQGIAAVSAKDFAERKREIEGHLAAILKLLGDAAVLSDEQRKTALRVQGEEEVVALTGVLDYADTRPEVFVLLADQDHGVDRGIFETNLLRDRLVNAGAMGDLATQFVAVASRCSDSSAYLGTLSKGPALLAYEIAKPHMQYDKINAGMLTPAVNLYRARALDAAKSRTANADAAAQPSETTSSSASSTTAPTTADEEPEK